MSVEYVPAAFGPHVMMQSMESGVGSLCTTFQMSKMISGLTEASGRSAEVWESLLELKLGTSFEMLHKYRELAIQT